MAEKRYLKRFADDTAIHGVKELYDAKPIGKFFWSVLLIVSICVMAIQFVSIMRSYINQDTGSAMKPYTPSTLPNVYICPRSWIDHEKVPKHMKMPNMRKALNGFLPKLGVDEAMNDVAMSGTLKNVDDAVKIANTEIKKHGNSITKFFKSIAWNSTGRSGGIVFPSTNLLGPNESMTLTSNGFCYKFSTDEKINLLQMKFARVKFEIGVHRIDAVAPNKADINTSDVYMLSEAFKVSVGTDASSAVTFNTEETLTVGKNYIIKMRPTRMERYSTRKWPCKRNWTYADSLHCIVDHGNKGCREVGSCETFVPETKNFGEVIAKDKYCNHVGWSVLSSCVLKTVTAKLTDQQWNKICPRPCVHEYFEFTYEIKTVEGENNLTEQNGDKTSWIELKAAGGGEGLRITEFLIHNTESMLSSVGGTTGLWLGVSVVSVVQILYIFCLEGLMNRFKGGKKNLDH